MFEEYIKQKIKAMPTIETDRLIMRRITVRDAEDIYEYSSDPEVPKFLTWSVHEDLKYTKKYLKFLVPKYKNGEYLDWGLELKDSGKLIGTCGFTSFDAEHARGELGYVINRSYWNKGYASEALKRALEYSFYELELNRISARVMEGNDASVEVLKKCNMRYEGTFRQELYVKEQFVNVMHFAICRDEYIK